MSYERDTELTEFVLSPIVVVTAGSALLAALVSTVLPRVAMAAVVAAVPVVGPVAAVGGATGIVIHDLLRGALGHWTFADAAWIFVFAGFVAWLVSPPLDGRDDRQPLHRWILAYVGAVSVAGIFATATGGWVAMILQGQRFYAAFELLAGIPLAAAVGIPVLIGRSWWTDRDSDRAAVGNASTEGSLLGRGPEWPDSMWHPVSARAELFLCLVGLAWLAGSTGIDVLAHDIGVFETEGMLRRYVVDFVGAGSPIVSAATAFFVGVYRYGEWAVRLSAPIVGVVVWMVYRHTEATEAGATRTETEAGSK